MIEAALLVMLVVFLFLQKWRASLIPIMALIVSIVGTFAGLYVLGYSINTLTLFGMVLAIGIVVDDAIVVVENIERKMREFNLPAKEAALQAMEEVTAPVIAIVCVLCAVFIPVAFLGGIAGQLYRQFAITIAISVVISGLVALSLSPAIAAPFAHTPKERPLGRPIQCRLQQNHRRLSLPHAQNHRLRNFRHRRLPLHSRRCLFSLPPYADEFCARGRSRLSRRHRLASRRGKSQANRRRRPENRRDRDAPPSGRACRFSHRL